MLTEATNASYDCGEYEFYAGEKVEENYAELQEKAEVTRTKVIEDYNELERENKRLRGVLAKIANLPTDQLASPEQCVAVVLAMDALSELPNV